jgi:S-adenosylmethionine-diacylgycerolhomoserine-N-methlytransferase
MDAIYRFQRHFYDITREPYLLGRDVAIRALDVPEGGNVLEIGCGTGRNLLKIARFYPSAHCFGVDISANMLRTANRAIARADASKKVVVARADAATFDPQKLFGAARFDRVIISYALSMIPQWEDVLYAAVNLLSADGALHVVDFGDQSGLPPWFRHLLFAWLARFSVTPREEMRDHVAGLAWTRGYDYRCRQLYRGYAALAELTVR